MLHKSSFMFKITNIFFSFAIRVLVWLYQLEVYYCLERKFSTQWNYRKDAWCSKNNFRCILSHHIMCESHDFSLSWWNKSKKKTVEIIHAFRWVILKYDIKKAGWQSGQRVGLGSMFGYFYGNPRDWFFFFSSKYEMICEFWAKDFPVPFNTVFILKWVGRREGRREVSFVWFQNYFLRIIIQP